MAPLETIGSKGLSHTGIMGADNTNDIALRIKERSQDRRKDRRKFCFKLHGSLVACVIKLTVIPSCNESAAFNNYGDATFIGKLLERSQLVLK